MYWIYILSCRDGSLYTGIAKDVDKRLKEHEEGRGSKYVRSRLPIRLLYTEKMDTHSSALKREAEIKSWSASQKWAWLKKMGYLQEETDLLW